jgi:hypothetical protein
MGIHHHDHPRLTRRQLLAAAAAFTPLAQAADGLPLGTAGKPRTNSGIWRTLRQRAAAMSVFDTHEHLLFEDERLAKRVDFFLLFSHYNDGDLVTAGMPRQAVTDLQNPDIPLESRWKQFAPYWPLVRTTGYGRCMMIAARDLYGVENIHEGNYKLLSDRLAAASKKGLYDDVLKKKARIELSVLDDLVSREGETLRSAPQFFKMVTRFDYITMAGTRAQLARIEKSSGLSISGLKDLESAFAKAVERAVGQGLAGIKIAVAYNRSLYFGRPTQAEASRAFEKVFGGSADDTDRKTLQDYLVHVELQHASERRLPVQIHTGMLAGNRNPVGRTNPSLLTEVLGQYPQVRFDLFHGGYPYCSELASIAKSYPNVYPDLCWLHIIAPGEAKRLLHQLIETVPANKILGYGGDFRHVEGAYGHAQMARAITAEVLAEKVESGYLKEEESGELLQRILYRNGKDLFG